MQLFLISFIAGILTASEGHFMLVKLSNKGHPLEHSKGMPLIHMFQYAIETKFILLGYRQLPVNTPVCPPLFKPFGMKCFHWSQPKIRVYFSGAQKACVHLGAILAEPRTHEELTFIGSHSSQELYLGMKMENKIDCK